jgi:hypothetical protein
MRLASAVPMLAFVLAACTAQPGQDNGIASAQSASASSTGAVNDGVKEAQCLRDQGIPAQDPATSQDKPRIPESVTREQLDAAYEHCRQFAPDYGKEPPPMDPARVELLRKFAQCMREQGLDWEDPDPNGRKKVSEPRRASERAGDAAPEVVVQAAKVCNEKVPGAGITFEGADGPKGSDPTR